MITLTRLSATGKPNGTIEVADEKRAAAYLIMKHPNLSPKFTSDAIDIHPLPHEPKKKEEAAAPVVAPKPRKRRTKK
jgi:hypothetical protein